MATLIAEQYMRQPVYTIASGESVARAVNEMQMRQVSSLIVPPRYADDPYGIITKHDVVAKIVNKNRDPLRVRVSDVMTAPVMWVAPNCTLRECAAIMMRHRIRRLPVFTDNQIIGVVSDSTVFDALLHFLTEDATYPTL